jgi:hypothetical protein
MAATTRASIMWATLQQTKHFARGKMMVGPAGLIGKWKTMTNNIASTMDFNLLGMPSDIAGTAAILPSLPPTPPFKTPPKRPRELDQLGDKRQYKKGGSQGVQDDQKYAMIVHSIIKEKLTPIVPKTLALKKLIAFANIRRIEDIFPGIHICVNGAIKGNCPFQNCPKIHDGTRVTNDMAKTVVSLLSKVIQNPTLIQNQHNNYRG